MLADLSKVLHSLFPLQDLLIPFFEFLYNFFVCNLYNNISSGIVRSCISLLSPDLFYPHLFYPHLEGGSPETS